MDGSIGGTSPESSTASPRCRWPDNTPLVMVTWRDSRQAQGSWSFLSQWKIRAALRVQTVGWLLQDDGDTVAISQSMVFDDIDGTDDWQVAGTKVIPKRAIESMVHLAEVVGSA